MFCEGEGHTVEAVRGGRAGPVRREWGFGSVCPTDAVQGDGQERRADRDAGRPLDPEAEPLRLCEGMRA